jgi:hypothetical protein
MVSPMLVGLLLTVDLADLSYIRVLLMTTAGEGSMADALHELRAASVYAQGPVGLFPSRSSAGSRSDSKEDDEGGLNLSHDGSSPEG